MGINIKSIKRLFLLSLKMDMKNSSKLRTNGRCSTENMMINKVNHVREYIFKYFDSRDIKEDTRETHFSPDKKYRIESVEYHQNKADLSVDFEGTNYGE